MLHKVVYSTTAGRSSLKMENAQNPNFHAFSTYMYKTKTTNDTFER